MWSHPPASAAALASGLFQYPAITVGPFTTISPTSPGPQRLPSSASIATCEWMVGRPAEPTLRNASAAGSIVAAADTSVRLKPCSIGTPRAWIVRSSDTGTGAPPEHATRQLDRSAVAKRGCSLSCWRITGTDSSAVTRSCSNRSSSRSLSTAGSSTSRAPAQ